ncbi:MAG: ribonuclease PH, partial [bacterium]
PVEMEPEFVIYPEGSVLISTGRTRVLCNASVDESQPHHLADTGMGWVTAEYSMLPRSAPHRQVREVVRGKRKGRTHEIQRLIGRAYRAVMDLKALGQRTIWVDCDVLQADGGTRTASVTGGFVALVMAVRHLLRKGRIDEDPVKDHLAAVSVGKVDGDILLDLNYEEDNRADVDMNLVMTESGEFVEIQSTGEEAVYDRSELDQMLELGEQGIQELIGKQDQILDDVPQ